MALDLKKHLEEERAKIVAEAEQVQKFIQVRERELEQAKNRLQQLLGKIELIDGLPKTGEDGASTGTAIEAEKPSSA